MFAHGPSTCTRCWNDTSTAVQEREAFRLVRDPGHWGASDPRILVLGISKGNTQSNAFTRGPFDEVAFKGIRDRLLRVMQSVGLLPEEVPAGFERRFSAEETDLAFASMVRCSLTGWNKAKGAHTADSPCVVPAFERRSCGHSFVTQCVDQHLERLPSRTSLVLLLGNADRYVSAARDVILRSRGGGHTVNPMAYFSNAALFVHVAHPSRGNGHFGAFLRNEGKQGAKRTWAAEAVLDAGIS